jgi:hypothetical protein
MKRLNAPAALPGRRGLLSLLVLGASLPAVLLAPLPGGVRAEPNTFEQRKIEAHALEAFRSMLGLWQEELYFELYDRGMEASKERISREEFAQRMVELSYVPIGELNPKFIKTAFRFRTMVYLSARVRYRHKFNPTSVFFKDHTFLLLREKGTWRIDLIRLIRAPFA